MISAAEIANKIPEIDKATKAFPAGANITKVYDELSPIAVDWQRENGGIWSDTVFNDLFYGGGPAGGYKLYPNTGLDGVSPNDTRRVYEWTMAAMRSFYPKHEHKEALCSMLLATFFLEPKMD